MARTLNVRVPKCIAKTQPGVKTPLGPEEYVDFRVSPPELGTAGMQAVGQIMATAVLDRGVDEGGREGLHGGVAGAREVEEHDKTDDGRFGVAEERIGVGVA